MTPRRQRMLAVGLAASGILIATALTLEALKDNMMFFISVTDYVAGEYPAERNFSIGGLVVDGSVAREAGSRDILVRLSDLRCEMAVTYSGVLPDLFREGQGVVAHGRVDTGGMFVADTILAKHDENYMAPEVAASLAKHVIEQAGELVQGGTECES